MILEINKNQYLELEKIAIGAFHPLDGFMLEKEFNSVVDNLRLPNGAIFSLPVMLDISEDDYLFIKNEKKVDLSYGGGVVGCLYPESFYTCDRSLVASKIYGTKSHEHPGVSYFLKLEPVFVGGKIELFKRPSLEFSSYEFTPAETKKFFLDKKWKTIVGFQTRNAPHRAHEYLLRIAMEVADGLFVQPLVGHKKSGDFTPKAILMGYEALIKNYFPDNKVLLGTLSTVMRYAGPREAVFHAIVRRNYGCTHFIIGRDHAGVGDWYGLYDAHSLAKKLEGELGIQILNLNGPYYCQKCNSIATISTCSHEGTNYAEHISGTYIRNILRSGMVPDANFMREEVISALSSIDCFID